MSLEWRLESRCYGALTGYSMRRWNVYYMGSRLEGTGFSLNHKVMCGCEIIIIMDMT